MIKIFDIEVDEELVSFVDNEVLVDLNLDKTEYWKGFSSLINEFNPLNQKLLNKRTNLQQLINEWHSKRAGREINQEEYKKFLYDIGYLVYEGPDFIIETKNIDSEIANISGPQLVVPITNARYALNAVNARWGSLYDAIYGTDVLGSIPESNSYDPIRGDNVINYAKSHFDKTVPLIHGSWTSVQKFELEENKIVFYHLNKTKTFLKDDKQFIGYRLNESKKINN